MARQAKPTEEFIGMRFTRLVIVREAEKHGATRYFECKCDCGTVKTFSISSLKGGKTRSCGCLQRELNKMPKLNRRTENYPYRGTRLYVVWQSMKKRCSNPNCYGYRWYGARGIKVCDEWKNRFIAFREWSIANGYTEGLTIDRIDNNGDYEPNNCRWITIQEQQKNRSK